MSWTARTTPFGTIDGYTLQIASNDDGSVIVAVGSANQGLHNAATIIRSTDNGVTWAAAASTPSPDSFFQLQPNGALIWDTDNQEFLWTVALQAGGWATVASADGDTWTTRNTNGTGITFLQSTTMRMPGLGLTSVLIQTVSANNRFHLTSPDNVTWTPQTLPAFTTPQCAAWSEPEAIGIVVGDGILYKTTDGTSYSTVTMPSGVSTVSWVIWSDTHSAFYAVGQDAGSVGVILASTDGISWAVVYHGSTFDTLYRIGELADGSLLTGGGAATTLGQPGGLISQDAGASWNPSPFIPGYGLMFAIHSTADGINLLGDQPQDASHLTAVWTGTPIRDARSYRRIVPPLWRFLLADLDGTIITDYSKLATNRYVEKVLNAPLKMGGQVPSEFAQVYLPFPDPDSEPYLAEGVRLLWGLRKESRTPPYYTCRAATMVQLVTDDAQQDLADTDFVGYDPWFYMYRRPVLDEYGNLPGDDGLTFVGEEASVIAGTLLARAITETGHTYIDAGTDYLGTGSYGGTDFGSGNFPRFAEMQTGIIIPEITFPQGCMLGQAWSMMTDAGYCDILLDPIFDPFNRPNYLVEMSVVAQAGNVNPYAIFAWNLPGRNVIALNRQEDGSDRANDILLGAGQGGSGGVAAVATDVDSENTYGEYWAIRFYPGASLAYVEALADAELLLRKDRKTTVIFTPEPTRHPRPWLDYEFGDRCPLWASRTKFRKLLTTA